MLRDYQKCAFNKIIEYDKSIIIWPRQTGKSLLINKIIENFVLNNNNKIMLFITDLKSYFSNSISRIQTDIDNVVVRYKKNDINFINNNKLIFLSIKDDIPTILLKYKPELIVYDGYMGVYKDVNKFLEFNSYYSIIKCKLVFTFFYNIDLIKTADCNNDFYINIFPYDKNTKYIFDSIDSNLNSDVLKDLSYKSCYLLDYYDESYIRKQKIQALNSLNSI